MPDAPTVMLFPRRLRLRARALAVAMKLSALVTCVVCAEAGEGSTRNALTTRADRAIAPIRRNMLMLFCLLPM
jgi:hypothetical protein